MYKQSFEKFYTKKTFYLFIKFLVLVKKWYSEKKTVVIRGTLKMGHTKISSVILLEWYGHIIVIYVIVRYDYMIWDFLACFFLHY